MVTLKRTTPMLDYMSKFVITGLLEIAKKDTLLKSSTVIQHIRAKTIVCRLL